MAGDHEAAAASMRAYLNTDLPKLSEFIKGDWDDMLRWSDASIKDMALRDFFKTRAADDLSKRARP